MTLQRDRSTQSRDNLQKPPNGILLFFVITTINIFSDWVVPNYLFSYSLLDTVKIFIPGSATENKRWRLVSAQCQTNLVIVLLALSLLFLYFTNTAAYHLGRFEPSSPSTKELHVYTVCNYLSRHWRKCCMFTGMWMQKMHYKFWYRQILTI